MKNYRYRAKKSPTDVREGVMPAETEEEVIGKLNDLGLVVVQIQEEVHASPKVAAEKKEISYRGAHGHAVTRFYKQLGRVLQSGIPILPALALMGEQTENIEIKRIAQEVQKIIAEGHPLSYALSLYPEYFSPFDLAMIEAGELVGHLDEALKSVSTYRENQEKLVSKIKGALAYPVFVMVAGFFAVVFMLAFVMPKFTAFFVDLGQELPFLTRLLISSSQFAQKSWPAFILGGAILFWIIKNSLNSSAKQIGWHRFYLSLPKVGKLIRCAQFARFSRTLSLLLESGIPLLKALQASLPVVTNQAIRKELEEAHAALTEGGSFSESLRRSSTVPVFVTHLVRAGEESGRLQESLDDVADWYEQELEENAEILTKLLEPILILLVGSLLGLMIVAVLLPVFSMNAAVS